MGDVVVPDSAAVFIMSLKTGDFTSEVAPGMVLNKWFFGGGCFFGSRLFDDGAH